NRRSQYKEEVSFKPKHQYERVCHQRPDDPRACNFTKCRIVQLFELPVHQPCKKCTRHAPGICTRRACPHQYTDRRRYKCLQHDPRAGKYRPEHIYKMLYRRRPYRSERDGHYHSEDDIQCNEYACQRQFSCHSASPLSLNKKKPYINERCTAAFEMLIIVLPGSDSVCFSLPLPFHPSEGLRLLT